MDDREWTRNRLMDLGQIVSAHEVRIAAMERDNADEREQERQLELERHRQRPSWVSICLMALSVIVSIAALYAAAHPQPPHH